MSLFSDRYPFVNGEFIPPKTKASPEPKNVLDVSKRIEIASPPKKDDLKRQSFAKIRAAKAKKKRGF
jgi:hypothetical protein